MAVSEDRRPGRDSSIDLASRLTEFRSSFRRIELEPPPAVWRYWRGGVDGDPVLWLTGALGAGELAFLHALRLAPQFRVLLPDYPPVATLDALVEGLAALLDSEEVEAAHVVGGSFGGMVAQRLAHRHPERIRSLVLSHTMAPRPSLVRTSLIRAVSLLVPERPYRALFRRRLRDSFSVSDPFWAEWFESTVASMSKAELASRVSLANEFLQTRPPPAERRQSVARVLIVQSDDDPVTARSQADELRRLYPTAETHTFSGMGHSATIVQPDVYVDVLLRFLTAGAG